MLGLFLIFFIGKRFYQLSESFNKSKWLFAILGIASYYIANFLAGLIFAVMDDVFGWGFLYETSEFAISLFLLPFGILGCYGFYKLLEHIWSKEPKSPDTIDGDYFVAK
ncbi:hypothetical protein [Mangrovivirga cuniculi]|uniref:Uncharacterized protein n=1 Tax=Mangrovivirga cuniculi TaxID=2715131 RepID=A0A4D7JQQ9_9BACT|nr:hypothetical protein [Mangrovivirga cuniculi]QCK13916.1 hypothetical protein DCC35_03650 [Mangrovivirga cuniculi]